MCYVFCVLSRYCNGPVTPDMRKHSDSTATKEIHSKILSWRFRCVFAMQFVRLYNKSTVNAQRMYCDNNACNDITCKTKAKLWRSHSHLNKCTADTQHSYCEHTATKIRMATLTCCDYDWIPRNLLGLINSLFRLARNIPITWINVVLWNLLRLLHTILPETTLIVSGISCLIHV